MTADLFSPVPRSVGRLLARATLPPLGVPAVTSLGVPAVTPAPTEPAPPDVAPPEVRSLATAATVAEPVTPSSEPAPRTRASRRIPLPAHDAPAAPRAASRADDQQPAGSTLSGARPHTAVPRADVSPAVVVPVARLAATTAAVTDLDAGPPPVRTIANPALAAEDPDATRRVLPAGLATAGRPAPTAGGRASSVAVHRQPPAARASRGTEEWTGPHPPEAPAQPTAPPTVQPFVQIGRIEVQVSAPEAVGDPFAGCHALEGGVTARRGGAW